MYADDTKLGRRIESIEDNHLLQMDLNTLIEWSTKCQLRFNASKCKILNIGSRRHSIIHTYTMEENGQSVNLELSNEERDLGIWVDSRLKFEGHVAKSVSRANAVLGMIKQSFVYMDVPMLRQLYIALVRPHLEYGSVVWHPRFKKDIDILESVQHRATRLVPALRKMSYEERLKMLNLPSLVYRRLRGDLIEVFKYLHGYYNVTVEGFLSLVAPGMPTRGHSMKLLKKQCRTEARTNFFSFRVVNLWNRLPEELVTASSLNCFKNGLDSYWGDLKFSSSTEQFLIGRNT